MKPILMCGGVGTKMWPMSRQKMPKHFLPLFNGKSLFEINYETLRQKFLPSDIYVSTTESQYELVKKTAPEIPEENYFLEPEMRNTGPAIGFVAAKLYRKYPDEVFVIVQTDILREPGNVFLDTLMKMEKLVLKHNKWLTGAIKPPFFMKGVDYMVSGEKLEEEIWDLSSWLQRDKEAEIEEAMKNNKAWLHANHYCWTPRLWLESYMKFRPDWAKPLMEIANGGDEKKIYPEILKGPTEEWTIKSVLKGEGMMVVLPFKWMDFGTWESLDKYFETEGAHGNTPVQDIFEIDSKNNFIKSKRGKFVATIGVDDLIIVDTDDALLVCKKSQSGRVGEVVEYLKTKNPNLL